MNKAKIQILSELMSFPTINQKDWISEFCSPDIEIGDLVSLSSAPPSKWYLSWVVDTERNDDGYLERTLLKSIEDDSLCWWSNVGFNIYSRKKVSERPMWKWTDKQFAFYDRWNRVCFKWNDAYIILPMMPVFKDDGSVVLDVRIRFALSDYSKPKTFKNWKKLTMKMMDKYYKKCELDRSKEK